MRLEAARLIDFFELHGKFQRSIGSRFLKNGIETQDSCVRDAPGSDSGVLGTKRADFLEQLRDTGSRVFLVLVFG